MNIEEQLVQLLKDYNLHVSCAESCTGGLIASTIINVPGASNILSQSFITYSIESKMEILGIEKELIEKYGVASNEVSHAMVLGLRRKYSDELLISSTGFAGEKNNLCFYSIMFKDHIEDYKIIADGTRNIARYNQTQKILFSAYEMVKKYIR